MQHLAPRNYTHLRTPAVVLIGTGFRRARKPGNSYRLRKPMQLLHAKPDPDYVLRAKELKSLFVRFMRRKVIYRIVYRLSRRFRASVRSPNDHFTASFSLVLDPCLILTFGTRYCRIKV